jgi:hypothetical protein
MRKLVSPLDGIKSPLGRRDQNTAVTLLGSEGNGLAIDFTTNSVAVRVS